MNEPIRVIQVLAQMKRGGAETMIMNLYRKIDRTKVQFDFVVHTDEKCDYDDEICRLGGMIFRVPRYTGRNHFKYTKAWENLLVQHPEYRIIHGHVRSTAAIYLKIAKRHKLVTIAHSHSTSSDEHKAIKRILQCPISLIAEYMFACSMSAGEWLFGKKALMSDKFYILNNSIETGIFKQNSTTRIRIRDEYELGEKVVVGHIGRFDPLKNHAHILEIFNEILKQHKDSMLLLIGDGALRQAIAKKAMDMKLDDRVLFLGIRSDVPQLLQAMDLFLFPSLYEGLGIVLIEAQAAGLPCLASDRVPKEAKVTDLLVYIPLEESPERWAQKALKMAKDNPRRDRSDEVKAAGYDIAESARWLQDFYLARHVEVMGNQP